jgi:hypothetical protein
MAVLGAEYFEDLLAGYGDFDSPLWEVLEVTKDLAPHGD